MENELTIPRFEVIQGYPNNNYKIGKVLTPGKDLDAKAWVKELQKYPHLFRKLEWWEKRKIKDMPQFLEIIKTINGKNEIGNWFDADSILYSVDKNDFVIGYDNVKIECFKPHITSH